MTHRKISIFIDEVFSKASKKNYITNKSDVSCIDDTWSLVFLDLNDFGPENNRGYRLLLVAIDNFSKFGWTVPLQ